MREKLLSIIVPSYNMERYLPKCLNSLFIEDGELMRVLEVIVVNDGSKDRTSEIAHQFEQKCPDVFRVVDKQNGHYGSCINVGLAIANGIYIKILDADDSFDNKVFRQYLLHLCNLSQLSDPNMPDLILNDFVWERGDSIEVQCLDLPVGTVLDIESPQVKLPFLYMHQLAHRTDNLRRMGYRQTEGICYTDNEWCHLPISKVNRLIYYKLPLYRYWVGRAGQSINPKEIRKNFTMWCQEALQLSGNVLIANEASEKVHTFLVEFAFEAIKRVYYLGIIEHLSRSNPNEFEMFCKKLVSCKELYDRAGELSCGPNHFRFHYVSFYRKHGDGLLLYLRQRINDFLICVAKVSCYSRWHS